jgi:hypothetical protein
MRRGSIDVSLFRIRDVQGEMVVTVRLMEVDGIHALRRPLIALKLLGPDWLAT